MTGDPRTEALLDELEAAHAAAKPRTYRCCLHCPDDPIAHENGQRDHHDLPCDICTEYVAVPALIAAVRAGLALHQPTHDGDGAPYCRDDSQDWPCNTRRAMTLDEEGHRG